MNQQTLELILKMRDQATATWKKFEGGVRGGMQRLGGFISKNWASIGVGIGAAFYVAIQALEKVDRIAKKVSQSAKDINAQKAAAQLQKIAEYAQKAQQLVDELIVRASLVAVGVGNAIATFFASLYTSVAFVITKITGGLASMAEYGALAAHALRNFDLAADLTVAAVKLRDFEKTAESFVAVGIEKIKLYGKETTDALGAAFASSEALGLSFEKQAEPLRLLNAYENELIEGAQEAIQWIKGVKFPNIIDPKTIESYSDMQHKALQDELSAYWQTKLSETAILEEWYLKAQEMAQGNIFQLEEIERVYRDRKAELDITSAQKTMATIQSMTSQVMNVLVGFSKNRTDKDIQQIERRKNFELERIDEELAKETLSEEQRNILLDKRKDAENKFNRQIRSAKKKQFEAEKQAAIIESIIATAVAVVKALPNIPLSIAVGILGAAKTAVIAGQPTPEFHQGGTVPGPEGKEVVAVLKAGETVRTREQENALGGGVTVIVNINAPGTPEAMVKRAVEEGLKRTGLPVTEYFVQNKENLVLA